MSHDLALIASPPCTVDPPEPIPTREIDDP
jgi:hypothetical protein